MGMEGRLKSREMVEYSDEDDYHSKAGCPSLSTFGELFTEPGDLHGQLSSLETGSMGSAR